MGANTVSLPVAAKNIKRISDKVRAAMMIFFVMAEILWVSLFAVDFINVFRIILTLSKKTRNNSYSEIP